VKPSPRLPKTVHFSSAGTDQFWSATDTGALSYRPRQSNPH
jgi:hypothetical protein